jgi:hypothetical protein
MRATHSRAVKPRRDIGKTWVQNLTIRLPTLTNAGNCGRPPRRGVSDRAPPLHLKWFAGDKEQKSAYRSPNGFKEAECRKADIYSKKPTSPEQ